MSNPLQNEAEIKRNSKDKAKILNDQFKSVFTLNIEIN